MANNYLCEYCSPGRVGGHYNPVSGLVGFHRDMNDGKRCTCWCAGRENSGAVKTQKAKGIVALQQWQGHLVESSTGIPAVILFDPKQAESERALSKKGSGALISKLKYLADESRRCVSATTGLVDGDPAWGLACLPPDITGCVFARPCPTRPRHGFVDSRCIPIPAKITEEVATKLLDQLNEVWRESTEADPEAEMLLMPFVPAQFNMVATPSQITVGPGHNGATDGHDTVSFPLLEVEIPNSRSLMTAAGIKNCPYFEAVGFRNHAGHNMQSWPYKLYVTQLRDGPKTKGKLQKNYIPRDTVVKKVIPARGSLLEWEKTIENLSKNDYAGIVVWHPRGSLVSHYAVHCRGHKIPIVTDIAEPTIGVELKATSTGRQAETEPDRDELLAGIREGLSINGQDILPSEAIILMLYAMHNCSSMDLTDPFMARLLGYSFGIAVQLGAVACIAEMRHGDCAQTNHDLGHIRGGTGKDREVVYKERLKDEWITTFTNFTTRYQLFTYDGWSGSVGGIRWYECAEAALKLWNSICRYFSDSTVSYQSMLADLNRVVNVCHNGAKMLTKYTCGKNFFDIASKSPIFIGLAAAPTIYKLSNLVRREDASIDFKPVEIKTYEQWRAIWTARRALAGQEEYLVLQ